MDYKIGWKYFFSKQIEQWNSTLVLKDSVHIWSLPQTSLLGFLLLFPRKSENENWKLKVIDFEFRFSKFVGKTVGTRVHALFAAKSTKRKVELLQLAWKKQKGRFKTNLY